MDYRSPIWVALGSAGVVDLPWPSAGSAVLENRSVHVHKPPMRREIDCLATYDGTCAEPSDSAYDDARGNFWTFSLPPSSSFYMIGKSTPFT